MDFIRQHTRHAPATERAALWGEINRAHFGELEVDAMDEGLDEAELTLFRLDDLRVFRIEVPAHQVRRRPRHRDDSLDHCFKLLLQLRGHGRIRQGAREFELRPSDWSLYDPRVPYTIDNRERASLLAVQIPRSRLHGLTGLELHTCESPTSGGVGLAAVLGSFLISMSEQLPTLPDDASTAVAETVLGLLSATLAHGRAEAQEHATLPDVLRARVRQYVQTRWADPTLNIDQIAAAMRCSKRHLHRAFDDGEQTLDRYIWRTRLANARRLLQSERGMALPIGVLAGACGFRTASHFCRLFKAEFGVPPGDIRRSRAALHRPAGRDPVQ
jgi:AraC-like DNA-binding protein